MWPMISYKSILLLNLESDLLIVERLIMDKNEVKHTNQNKFKLRNLLWERYNVIDRTKFEVN